MLQCGMYWSKSSREKIYCVATQKWVGTITSVCTGSICNAVRCNVCFASFSGTLIYFRAAHLLHCCSYAFIHNLVPGPHRSKGSTAAPVVKNQMSYALCHYVTTLVLKMPVWSLKRDFPQISAAAIFTIEVNGIVFVLPTGLEKVRFEQILLNAVSVKETDP